MTPRGNIFFSDGRFGWSETYFCTQAVADLAAAETELFNLAKVRVEMLGYTAQIDELRVSDDEVFRDSLVNTIKPNNSSVYVEGAFGVPPDIYSVQPYASLLLRMESGSLYRKALYLSGIPHYLYVNPWTGPITDATFLPLYNAYTAMLLNGKWGFKVHTQPGGGAGAPITSTNVNITIPDDLTIQVETSTPNFFNLVHAGDKVRIRGVRLWARKSPRISGTYVVKTAGSGTVVVLFAPGHLNQSGYITNPGIVWIDKVEIKPITGIIQEGFNEHRRGRPFAEPRGRRART